MDDIHVQRKILDGLYEDYHKLAHRGDYKGCGPMRFVGKKTGDINTVVRCIKHLIEMNLVEGTGESEYQVMLWQYIKLSPPGLHLCQHPHDLDNEFPDEPTQRRGKIGFKPNQ